MVVLVLDIQNDFLHENGSYVKTFGLEETKPLREMVENVLIPFLKRLDDLGIKIILIKSNYRQGMFKNIKNLCIKGSFGEKFYRNIDKMFSKARIFVKNCNDALTSRELLDYLLNNKFETLIIVGITGTTCVTKTAESALEKGFKVIIIEDCVASRKSRRRDQEEYFKNLKRNGAIILNSQDFLKKLMEGKIL